MSLLLRSRSFCHIIFLLSLNLRHALIISGDGNCTMRALQSLRAALSGGLDIGSLRLRVDWPRSNCADSRLEEVVKWELLNIRILDHCGRVWCRSYHRFGNLWYDFGWNLENCRRIKGIYEMKPLTRRWRAQRVIILQVTFTWKIHSVLVPYIILNKELSRFISDGLTLL